MAAAKVKDATEHGERQAYLFDILMNLPKQGDR